MFKEISIFLWMQVPHEERQVLVRDFNLPKTGISEIRDQDVISDGYSKDDLSRINVATMSEYVGSPETESFSRLWELTCAKAHAEANPPMGVIGTQEEADTLNESIVKVDEAKVQEAPIEVKVEDATLTKTEAKEEVSINKSNGVQKNETKKAISEESDF